MEVDVCAVSMTDVVSKEIILGYELGGLPFHGNQLQISSEVACV